MKNNAFTPLESPMACHGDGDKYKFLAERARSKAPSFLTGFSLLEIIIAMLILSVVTAGAYSLFVTNHKMLINARHRLQAVEQASSVIEKLRMYVSENPDYPANAGTVDGHALDGDGVNGEVQSPSLIGLGGPIIDPGITGEWSYEVVEDISQTDCEKVTVTVKWSEP